MRIAFTALAAMSLLTACGGGGSGTTTAGGPYTFIAPKVGAHLVYSAKLVDNLNNTVNRTVVDDVTSVDPDGSFAMHEEDPSHNVVVAGSTDQSLYPTDYRFNAAAQPVNWVVTQPAGAIACSVTQGTAGAAPSPFGTSTPAAPTLGAPATLSVGASWNAVYIETCGAGPGTEYTQTGSLAGIESITIAAGTFSAFRFTSTITRTVNGITRTETATRWRDASGGDTRTLKTDSAFSYSGGTPPTGALVSASRELQSYR